MRFISDAFAVLVRLGDQSGSVLSLRVPSRHVVLSDPGEFIGCTYPVLGRRHWPSPSRKELGTPKYSHHPLPVGVAFRGYTGLHRYDLSSGLPPLADPTRNFPADRGFYSWASIGLVALPDARYNYGGT